ncbi:hypothetical protein HPL003_21690 [Paenibacillus terrae HPL-003]|uniref:Uncharacterized protein n=1 Tax=Paenibacillus terrae (strain HPL-003) TaxID=985665 RepID=G7VPR8_PAETH|nr:cysteine protease StiP domain-containing protein [Paenibacillus terrae]AET61066.1 hypothetical protein HPL003_21690 [Paenibacillus terrae HPL-003]
MTKTTWLDKPIAEPTPMGSYPSQDVTYLLKDLSDYAITELDQEERVEDEHFVKSFYVENRPSAEYMDMFHTALQESADRVALAAGILSELIIQQRGQQTMLASLRRSGTPIGVLVKRYLRTIHQVELPHYSFSIFKTHGLDWNALTYMIQQHPGYDIQFIDGWSGKGLTSELLHQFIAEFNKTCGTSLSSDLAVLADPAHSAPLYGTRDDFLLPCSLLNALVTGLISKSVINEFVGPTDFHGAKYYSEWSDQDVSNVFVDTVASKFSIIADEAKKQADRLTKNPDLLMATFQGRQVVQKIQQDFNIPDSKLVAPGIAETTKGILKRNPWKILVDRMDNPNLKHILQLAHERNIDVETTSTQSFSCFALFKRQ